MGATTRVLATNSFAPDGHVSWTNTELTLITLAHPLLDTTFFDADVVAASKSTEISAYIQPPDAMYLEDASPSASDIELMMLWETANVEETVDEMICPDVAGYD